MDFLDVVDSNGHDSIILIDEILIVQKQANYYRVTFKNPAIPQIDLQLDTVDLIFEIQVIMRLRREKNAGM